MPAWSLSLCLSQSRSLSPPPPLPPSLSLSLSLFLSIWLVGYPLQGSAIAKEIQDVRQLEFYNKYCDANCDLKDEYLELIKMKADDS